MKKTLLTVIAAAFVAIAVNAQKGATFIYDDFQTATQYYNNSTQGGVLWFTDNKAAIYSLLRTGNNGLGVTQTSALANTTKPIYAVVGATFGNATAPGRTIDISANKNASITVQVPSNTAAPDLDFTWQIVDINGNTLSVAADTTQFPYTCTWGQKYKLPIESTFPLGATSTGTASFAGTYAVLNNNCSGPCTCPTLDFGQTSAFDYTKVTQIMFIVQGGCTTNGQKSDGIGICFDGTFTITNFSFGSVPSLLTSPTPTSTVGGPNVTITWPSVSGATSYNIITTSTSGSGYTIAATVTTNSWNFAASNTGKVYYKVGAFNGINSWSAENSYTVSSLVTSIVDYSALNNGVSVAPNPSNSGLVNIIPFLVEVQKTKEN